MKKTLAVAAVLAAFAGSAAADVTVYGALDTALVYKHTSSGMAAGKAVAADRVAMKANGEETNRIGFKGTEKVSDDLTVGFKLEAEFDSDTGASSKTLMAREALVYAKTAYGEFGFGRTGSLGASTGSYAFLGGGNTGWGGGVHGVLDNGFILKGKASRLDNAITYVSPKFAGVTLYAQIASANDATNGNEYTHTADRYYAVGAKYAAGAFNAGLVATVQDYNQALAKVAADEAVVVSGFANYDFGVAKVALSGQYYDKLSAAKANDEEFWEFDSATGEAVQDEDYEHKEATAGVKGYGLTAAVVAPVAGGTLNVGLGYGEQEAVAGGKDKEFYSVGTKYVYKLSKQTALYAGLGYTATKVKADKSADEEVTALAGLYHTF